MGETDLVLAKRVDAVALKLRDVRFQGQIAAALPQCGLTAERMARLCVSSIRKTPKLSLCSWESLANAIMGAASLGLEPGTALGHCWILPFKDEAQLIVGYKGLIYLMYRTAGILAVADAVYTGDEFDWEPGVIRKHRPCESLEERGQLRYAYMTAIMPDSRRISKVVNRADIEMAKRSSAAVKFNKTDSPWFTHEPSMWMKTAVLRGAKFLPLSSEVARAIEAEEQADRGEKQVFDSGGFAVSCGDDEAELSRTEQVVRDLKPQAKPEPKPDTKTSPATEPKPKAPEPEPATAPAAAPATGPAFPVEAPAKEAPRPKRTPRKKDTEPTLPMGGDTPAEANTIASATAAALEKPAAEAKPAAAATAPAAPSMSGATDADFEQLKVKMRVLLPKFSSVVVFQREALRSALGGKWVDPKTDLMKVGVEELALAYSVLTRVEQDFTASGVRPEWEALRAMIDAERDKF